ncbi:CCR4-Not complex component, Not1, C-terminal [Artemisia annua]|uniref:CCR4-Not complex component, Not1, C-terminal n=1 Tax=Artemisia annua TaxID=35608 RepID=A0A2U1NT66_ARTAN|nr:CCR4-Not complex component, Not1, C-terminal [Artemisia annua]
MIAAPDNYEERSGCEALQSNTGLLSSDSLSKELERLHLKFTNNSSRMMNNGGPDSSTTEVYADDIEKEANSYFQQMFSGQLTVDEMIQMLAGSKESSEKREKSIFECMIANLFEEYKFFNRYPDKQLKLAGILFGLLIRNQLVTHLTLGIALRAVLDALRKPADSKMFVFGTKALEKFIDRLNEWPQYCQHILQISHLRGAHPELVTFIERSVIRTSSGHPESDAAYNPAADQHQSAIPQANIEPPQNVVSSSSALANSPAFVRPSRTPTSARFGSPLNIETLVAAERRETPIEAPPSETQDKISFIINNLSIANIESKAKEFTEVLKEEYYPWFAQYMVMKSDLLMLLTEQVLNQNFHDLYLKFLEKANSKPLNRDIVQATYENCKVLLGSELIKSSSEERSLLKNLGGWLGKITIGRNHVLRAKEIDPKALIIEGYVDAVNSRKSQPGHTNHAWLCLDLLEILCQLAERGLAKNGQFMCRISFLANRIICDKINAYNVFDEMLSSSLIEVDTKRNLYEGKAKSITGIPK